MKVQCSRILSISVTLLFLAATMTNVTGCTVKVQAADMMEGIAPNAVSGRQADAKFIGNTADFSLELFQHSIEPDQNSLVSPLSVLLALGMTANGADTSTLTEMEAVLGRDIPLTELNEYLYTYVDGLPSAKKAKFSIANSIWFRDDQDSFTVEQDFLQTNADYYGAAAYKATFDKQTLKDINNWVTANTDGMIDKVLDEIPAEAVMYLINAIAFDAEWKVVYDKHNVRRGEFTTTDGTKQDAEFMTSDEFQFINTPLATGFIKPYADDNYSFVALLPNEEIDIQDYLASLSGESFLHALSSAVHTPVAATLPKFSYDYSITLNDSLQAMGMPAAFAADQADFSRLGKAADNIYIDEVIHKTFISVDEKGTRAGAVTAVGMKTTAMFEQEVVILDRPFVYAIIDSATNLPIFIGIVMGISE